MVIVTIQKEKDSLEIKYFAVALSALLIIGGLYFKFLYNVPDGEEKTNNLVSWFLVVMGIIGFMMAEIWKFKNPLESFENDSKIRFLKNKNNQHNSSQSDATKPNFPKDTQGFR